jgi:hypothetical protein
LNISLCFSKVCSSLLCPYSADLINLGIVNPFLEIANTPELRSSPSTKIYTEIYRTKHKTVFVQVDGDERSSGVFAISKKGFTIPKFIKSAEYGHKRELHTLEKHRDMFKEYLPEGI